MASAQLKPAPSGHAITKTNMMTSTKLRTRSRTRQPVAPEVEEKKKGPRVTKADRVYANRVVQKLRPEDVSQYENYEIVKLDRGKIQNAPYNPRIITPEARQKLKANIKSLGLMQPFIWNSTTGNLVGGHQ